MLNLAAALIIFFGGVIGMVMTYRERSRFMYLASCCIVMCGVCAILAMIFL